jgi:hypothetical protein
MSIRVRNFAPLNEPLNILNFFFILTQKSPTRRNFMVQKSGKSERSNISRLGTLKYSKAGGKKRRHYSAEDIQQAAQSHQEEGMSLRQASERFSVPK